LCLFPTPLLTTCVLPSPHDKSTPFAFLFFYPAALARLTSTVEYVFFSVPSSFLSFLQALEGVVCYTEAWCCGKPLRRLAFLSHLLFLPPWSFKPPPMASEAASADFLSLIHHAQERRSSPTQTSVLCTLFQSKFFLSEVRPSVTPPPIPTEFNTLDSVLVLNYWRDSSKSYFSV